MTLGLLLITAPAAAAASISPDRYGGSCANRLCTKDVRDTPSCWRFSGYARTSRS